MKFLNLLLLLIPFLGFAQTKVGEEIMADYSTPHPYEGNDTRSYQAVWTEEIFQSGASYVAVHFRQIELSSDDFLVIRNKNNTRSWTYSQVEIQNKANSFWSIPIYGEKAIIEIFSRNSDGGYGYEIDKIAKGFSALASRTDDMEAICGADDSKNSICYKGTEPKLYNESRAVARLLINGTGSCTGWLVGDEGHILTNEHCIHSQSDANNVSIEFLAEGADCSTNCNSWYACPGTVAATSATLEKVDGPLDYALLKMATNVSGTYGFLQLRKSGAELNERIYIPQHPRGWGKRIAVNSSNSSDAGGVARVYSLTRPRCGENSGHDVGYYADTQGGSSGSPVLGYNDNLVVALHHCANCPNRGVPIEEIITDLGSKLPRNALPANCHDAVTVTQTVLSGNVDTQKAAKILTAINKVNSGATANYSAGQRVKLKPGFSAKSGSSFKAIIRTCGSESITDDARFAENIPASPQKKSLGEFNANFKNSDWSIFPIPANNTLFVMFDKNSVYRTTIYNSAGIKMITSDTDCQDHELDIRSLTDGIYYLNAVDVETGEAKTKSFVVKK